VSTLLASSAYGRAFTLLTSSGNAAPVVYLEDISSAHYIRDRDEVARYSSAQGNCVEVAPLRDGTAVSDSKDPAAPVLTFDVDAWRVFVAGVKSGQI